MENLFIIITILIVIHLYIDADYYEKKLILALLLVVFYQAAKTIAL